MNDMNTEGATGTVTVRDRRELVMDGVKNILGFDECSVTLETTLGEVYIEGDGLKVEALSEDGRISIKGRFDSLSFSGTRMKKGFLSGVFG